MSDTRQTGSGSEAGAPAPGTRAKDVSRSLPTPIRWVF